MKLPLRYLAAFVLAFPCAAPAENAPLRPWNEDVIYFALTDRFYDGDPENNVPAGSDPSLYDRTQTDIDLYHGGDFRGLELALRDGYFKELGITALWIPPPVRNVWNSEFDSNDQPKSGYHGYWTQDFLDIDPHLVSRRSLDGSREYPDTRDGRMQHYKDLVALAHRQGIKVVQDIVCNHAGPVFFYDENGNGEFDLEQKEEWIQPFKEDGFHANTLWADTPKWNQRRTAPVESVTVLGRKVKLNGALGRFESYNRKGMSPDSLGKSDGEEIECDFFGLRDFNTAPGSRLFDQLVDEFVEIYAFYLEEIGVDGLRIDTIKHVHHGFWDAFSERLRDRVGPERAERLLLFGEVYDGDPEKLGQYTYRTDWPEERGPSLDSLLNFQFCYAVRSYLRTPGEGFGKANELENTIRALSPTPPDSANRPYFNPTPGWDGLNSAEKMVNFVENHDGLNRFRVRGIGARRNLLANALALTMPGIPCLYYGTESALHDTRADAHSDSETGRLIYFEAEETAHFAAARNSEHFQALAGLIDLRRTLPALISGAASPLWVDSDATESDDGVFAFARKKAGVETLIVVVNASDHTAFAGSRHQPMKLVSGEGKPLLTQGEKLVRIPIAGLEEGETNPVPVEVRWKNDIPEIVLEIAPGMVDIYRITR